MRDLEILIHGAIQQSPIMSVEDIVTAIANIKAREDELVDYKLEDYDNIVEFRNAT